jgi:hypothetical protein
MKGETTDANDMSMFLKGMTKHRDKGNLLSDVLIFYI